MIKLNYNGSALVYSTYIGGNGSDEILDLAVDDSGAAYITGISYSTDFPASEGAFQTNAGNIPNAFVAKIVIDQPPSVKAGGPYGVNKGDSVQVIANGSDPNDEGISYAWDLNNDGTFESPGQNVIFSAIDGPATAIAFVQATNPSGLSAIDQAEINILNVDPTVGLITAPLDPIRLMPPFLSVHTLPIQAYLTPTQPFGIGVMEAPQLGR